MNQLSFGITLELKTFHMTGFESIDFRRRFGLDDSQSTYNCKYVQSRTEIDEAFARSWFGNATWHAAEVDPSWLLPGELVENEKTRDAVQIAPELPPERAKALYVRARIAKVEGERDKARTELDTLRGERDELSSTLSLAVDDRNQARFENEQLKAVVQRLQEQESKSTDRLNDLAAVANRNDRPAQEAEDQLRKLQAEHAMLRVDHNSACRRVDQLKELVDAQHDLIEVMKNKIAEQDELRRRYEQLQKDYDGECIKADQRAARINELESKMQSLGEAYARPAPTEGSHRTFQPPTPDDIRMLSRIAKVMPIGEKIESDE